jgi:D-glycero-alpha-D-manno-heptose 1-phosphate guanylyltransferase
MTDAVILCGGRGTRLRSVVADRPKPMAALGERPFLELLLDYAAGFGYRRFVLAAGYLAEAIERHFAGGYKGLEVLVSREPGPLDTAGAVKQAEPLLRGDRLLVLNGDSFCRTDLAALEKFAQEKGAAAAVTVAGVPDIAAYGAVELAADGRVTAFREKGAAGGAGLVNAGIYLLDRALLGRVPAGEKYSMERGLLPALVEEGEVFGFKTDGTLYDIGTPEGYRLAGEQLK